MAEIDAKAERLRARRPRRSRDVTCVTAPQREIVYVSTHAAGARVKVGSGDRMAMLTYSYALISNPCERTVAAMFDYVRAHPGRLLTLAPADSQAMERAIATTSCHYEHEYVAEAEEFMLTLAQRGLHY